MKNKIYILTTLFFIMIAVMFGCANNKFSDDSNIIDNSEIAENIGNDNTDDFQSIPEVVKKNYHGLNKNFKLNINAKVNADNYSDTVNIYTTNVIKEDEAYMYDLAKKIFDNGDFKVSVPYILMEDLEYDRFEKYLGKTDWEKKFCEKLQNDLNDVNIEEGKLFYKYYVDNVILKNEFRFDEAKDLMEFSRIEGKVDGRDFEMCTYKQSFESMAYIEFHSPDNKDFVYDGFVLGRENAMYIYNPNTCDLDYAREKAASYIHMLGKDNYKESYGFHRIMAIDDNPTKYESSGYRFIYTPSFDDIPTCVSANYKTFIDGNTKDLYVSQPMIIIDIDNDGLQKLTFSVDITEPEMLVSVSNQLSFDQVMDVFENYILNEDTIDDSYETINNIEYKYVLVKDNDGTAYVPAWVFTLDPMGSNDYLYDLYAVNAIDGSVIRFFGDNYAWQILAH